MADASSSGSGLRFSPWNLFLLVPFLMLVVPWFNHDEPRLFGIPFFYWSQLLFVPVGVACVSLVYVFTRDQPAAAVPGTPSDVDDLDEGTAGR